MNPASAKTSLNQVPALHKKIMAIHKSATVFDFGAGKMGKGDQFMVGVSAYFPYDPFNRSEEQNIHSLLHARDCDFVLCANVLNVIEDENLDEVITSLIQIVEQTKQKRAFLSVYHNSKLEKNRKVGNHFQRNEPLSWYVPRLEKYFSKVTKMNDILCINA